MKEKINWFLNKISFSNKTFFQGWLLVVLFYNPILTPLMVLLAGWGPSFLLATSVTLLIGTTVCTVVFVGTAGVLWVERALILRSRQEVSHSRLWKFTLSFLLMFPGLSLGFYVSSLYLKILGHQSEPISLRDYSSGIVWGLVISGTVFLAESYFDSREAHRQSELKVKQLENERLQAQISALTAQMNPHLLFNALNTIASMIPSDPKNAEETTLKLSQLYRGILDSSRHPMHSLATEIEICEAYLSVERSRFGSRLETKLEIDPALNPESIQVPALILQPLVENAVKHGISSRSSGGRIQIEAKPNGFRVEITVLDNGVGLGNSVSRSGAGTGLANCRSRIELCYGAQGNFEISPHSRGGTQVRIELPISKEASA